MACVRVCGHESPDRGHHLQLVSQVKHSPSSLRLFEEVQLEGFQITEETQYRRRHGIKVGGGTEDRQGTEEL